MDEYQYFVGKICTILTPPTTLTFSDFKQHAQYFTGEVTKVSIDGVWLQHPQAKTLAFFPWPLIGIVEEQVVEPNDPRIKQLEEEIKKTQEAKKAAPTQAALTKTQPRKPATPPNFIPIDELTLISKKD